MNTGILYNTFVCFISGLSGLITFFLLSKIRKKKRIKYGSGLDYFVLFLGLLWIFVAIRIFLTGTKNIQMELFVYKWIVGPLTFLHLIPAFYYIGWSFFGEKKKLQFLFDGFFTVAAFLAVFTLFMYGFERPKVTYWGNNIMPNKISNNIFTFGIFIPSVPFIVAEIIRRFIRWKKTGDIKERQLLGFGFGFLIYALAGFFEALIFTQGWSMVLTRIGIMLSPLTFYIVAELGGED